MARAGGNRDPVTDRSAGTERDIRIAVSAAFCPILMWGYESENNTIDEKKI
jgi:hypothetical protein